MAKKQTLAQKHEEAVRAAEKEYETLSPEEKKKYRKDKRHLEKKMDEMNYY